VGHNAQVANHVIMANGALLGGHAVVQDRAFISGNCLVHQFIRVGTLALMQGGSAVSMDLPPYTVVRAVNQLCGLNTVGLRRAGLTSAERSELKRLYHALFRSGQGMRAALLNARDEFKSGHARILIEFAAGSKRGLCADIARSARAQSDEST
jgi:UDP-N-acetylglucosamine acyltransferase